MSQQSSTDDQRSAAPLPHAESWVSSQPLELESGGRLSEVTVCFETWGTLDPDRQNAVLICHALSGDSHVARHSADDDPGWWEVLVGPGKPIDTDHYYVICSNVLGGCRGTTGPNFIDPSSGRPFGADFPIITVRDMVDVQIRLLDHLEIDRAFVSGNSLGGNVVWRLMMDHPERLLGVIQAGPGSPIAVSHISVKTIE